MPDRTTFPYGYCALLRSPEVAVGQAPAYLDFSSVTVPLASGFVIASQAAAAVAPPALAQPAVVQAASGGGRRLLQG